MHLSVYKRKLSLIYRKVIQEFFLLYVGLSNRQYIVVSIEQPSLANYLYGIIKIAWLYERMNINSKFVLPIEKLSFFANFILYRHNTNNTYYRRSFLINSLGDYLTSIARKVASKDLHAKFGYRIIPQLSIKQDIQHQVDTWFDLHTKDNWVAMHYYGTDAHIHFKLNERKTPINFYIVWLEEVLDKRCSIFFCFYQAQFIYEMQHTFLSRVYFREIKRSTNNKPISWLDNNQYTDKDLYQQKCDALIDILVSTKTSLIYTTRSQRIDLVKILILKSK